MARFFFAYARANKSPQLEQFFSDLESCVRKHGRGWHQATAFKDDVDIAVGRIWTKELWKQIDTASSLVCICTPEYYQSVYCGQEWSYFQARIALDPAPANTSLVIPVLWQSGGQQPQAIGQCQYYPSVASNATSGLFELALKGQTEKAYMKAVEQVAVAIVRETNRHYLRPLTPRIPFQTVPSGFHQPTSNWLRWLWLRHFVWRRMVWMALALALPISIYLLIGQRMKRSVTSALAASCGIASVLALGCIYILRNWPRRRLSLLLIPIVGPGGPALIPPAVNPPTVVRPLLTVVTRGGEASSVQLPDERVCPPSCVQLFAANASIRLRAVTGENDIFVSWEGGACAGLTQPLCEFGLRSSTTVVAHFLRRPPPPIPMRRVTVRVVGDGSVELDPTHRCAPNCVWKFPLNSTLQLMAHSDERTNHCLDRWSGSCSGRGRTCELTVRSDLNVTASFVDGSRSRRISGSSDLGVVFECPCTHTSETHGLMTGSGHCPPPH